MPPVRRAKALVARPGSISGTVSAAQAEAEIALTTKANPNPLRIQFPKLNFIVYDLLVK
jgi:hypothetical protein